MSPTPIESEKQRADLLQLQVNQLRHQVNDLVQALEDISKTEDFQHFILLLNTKCQNRDIVRRTNDGLMTVCRAMNLDREVFFMELDKRRSLTGEALLTMVNNFYDYMYPDGRPKVSGSKWIKFK
jgi:hypothetical protein